MSSSWLVLNWLNLTGQVWAQSRIHQIQMACQQQKVEMHQGVMATAAVDLSERPVMISGPHGIHKQRLISFWVPEMFYKSNMSSWHIFKWFSFSFFFFHPFHRHLKATMTLLLKAELWERARWMHRGKVDISHMVLLYFFWFIPDTSAFVFQNKTISTYTKFLSLLII